jgi:DNA-binding transcriptional MerR regulator
MSSRSYMSIGDVLTLLRQEFPDVTISKIRFLESQGLVNPERTPSGYRKFYDHDVERLRWVLRQQREHFLPLKVIKDRLDDGSATSEPEKVPTKMVRPDAAGSSHDSAEGQPAPDRDEHHGSEPVLVGHRATSDSTSVGAERHGNDERPEGDPVIGVTLPGIDAAEARAGQTAPRPSSGSTAGAAAVGAGSGRGVTAAGAGSAGVGSAGGGAAGRGTRATGGVSADAASPTGPLPAVGPTPGLGAPIGSGPDSPSASASGRAPGASEPEVPVSAPVPPKASAAGVPSVATGNGTGQRSTSGPSKTSPAEPPSPSVDLNGASLSLDELSSACGLTVTVLQELRSFGLLEPSLVAGVEYYDEESLAVANLAARFARFGIEPRHLRLYKNAADREAGFVEQIVLPLVRQRNPEARVRALETVDELTQLGQELRGSLLRSDLRSLLNG